MQELCLKKIDFMENYFQNFNVALGKATARSNVLLL